MIFFNGFVALVVAFLMLRKASTVRRHVLAFFVTGIVSGIIAVTAFEMSNPYPGYASGERFNATMDSLFAWVVGLVAGFVVAAVIAKLVRPKPQATPA